MVLFERIDFKIDYIYKPTRYKNKITIVYLSREKEKRGMFFGKKFIRVYTTKQTGVNSQLFFSITQNS